jgi:type IV conjugative transfer system protein TraL
MSDDNYWIPRTLDAPPLFFIVEADSAMIFLTWLILGAVMGGLGLVFGIFIGWACTRAYVRLKEEGGKGLILKILYWFMPSQWASKLNPSHIREHIGN